MLTVIRKSDRKTFNFNTEIEFREWLEEQPRGCKIKKINQGKDSRTRLDRRALKFLGEGGDPSVCIPRSRYFKQH